MTKESNFAVKLIDLGLKMTKEPSNDLGLRAE